MSHYRKSKNRRLSHWANQLQSHSSRPTNYEADWKMPRGTFTSFWVAWREAIRDWKIVQTSVWLHPVKFQNSGLSNKEVDRKNRNINTRMDGRTDGHATHFVRLFRKNALKWFLHVHTETFCHFPGTFWCRLYVWDQIHGIDVYRSIILFVYLEGAFRLSAIAIVRRCQFEVSCFLCLKMINSDSKYRVTAKF